MKKYFLFMKKNFRRPVLMLAIPLVKNTSNVIGINVTIFLILQMKRREKWKEEEKRLLSLKKQQEAERIKEMVKKKYFFHNYYHQINKLP